jgi:hypothetical protein
MALAAFIDSRRSVPATDGRFPSTSANRGIGIGRRVLVTIQGTILMAVSEEKR